MSPTGDAGRRAGVGLEVSRSVVRGVVVEDGPERVVEVAERPLGEPGDDEAVVAALVGLHRALAAGDRPTRIGWFPAGAALQRVDVTGTSAPDVNAIRAALDRDHGVTSSMVVDGGVRRWLLGVRWNEPTVRRIRELVARAGFAEPMVEPAPLSVHRVVEDSVTVVRRDADASSSWAMLRDGDLPATATTLPAGGREDPSIALSTAPVVLRDEVADVTRLVADVGVAVGSAFSSRAARSAGAVRLRMAGEPYPIDPDDDLRAPGRVVVALGAALAAAGHDGRARPVEALVPSRPEIDLDRRPWTLERIADDAVDDATPAPEWERTWSRLRRTRAR